MKTVDNGDGINQKSLRNKKLYKTSRGKEIEKRKKKNRRRRATKKSCQFDKDNCILLLVNLIFVFLFLYYSIFLTLYLKYFMMK